MVHAYDRRTPPGHCTGGAVDVNLVDESGDVLDVSAPYDRFVASRTYTLGLAPEAQERRLILLSAMEGAGFSNCRDEWWHYSYGDAAWAVRVGAMECSYGLIELEPRVYARQEREWLKHFKERPNPFQESSP
jgi:D-alanyl-D-alanine dipeptidase